MKYSTIDDVELIILVTKRDTEALGELYDRYSRLIFSLALKTVGNQAIAEEITQDVFFRVWEKAGTYHSEQAKVSTWLTSIARYRSIDVLRRQGVRPESNSVGWPDLSANSMPSTDGRGPEDKTEMAIQGERVRAAIAQLPLEQQQVLGLAYFHGYTHSQISEALQAPLGTVKTRIRLGMQKLRQMLEKEQFTP